MTVDDEKWGEVETLLEADMPHLENEVEALYNDIEYFAEVAGALDSTGRSDDSEYFRELAVDRYESFVNVIQLKKTADDYNF